MYRLARESQVRGSARGQDDDDLKVPALPDHTPHARSQEIPQVEEEDRKMPAASVPATAPSHQTSEHLYPQIEEEDRKMPAASTPGAVAALPTARDPAAIKQAAARDPARLSYASPNTAHNRSEARRSTQARQTETEKEDIKQKYRTAGATDEETPGATRVAGIDGSTTESFDDTSYERDRETTIDTCPVVQDPTFTEPTITAQLAPTDDEVMKRLVEDIPVAEAEVAPNRKRWFIIGGIGVLACAGLGAGLGVALGGDDSSPRTAPPPPVRADTCLDFGDGTFRCFKEAFPTEDVLTIFVNCPTNDEEGIFECESCVVVGVSDIAELTASGDDVPTCNGCLICNDRLSFDCTNLFPEDECALQTCSGNCGKDPVPSPSPDTEATECGNTQDGEFLCNKEDIPTDFLVTQFRECPPDAENNVFECQTCVVAFEDSVAGIDSATQVCNGCINCGDYVAYDCSNLFPGQACAAVDCDRTCFGDRQA